MRPVFLAAALASFGLAPSHSAHAQAAASAIEPGLWQFTVKLKSRSGRVESAMSQVEAELAKLSPGQRRAIEQRMASSGVSFPGKGGAMRVKSCLTKAQADRGFVPVTVQKDLCTQKLISSERNTLKMAVSCQTEPPSTGVAEVTVLGRRAVSVRIVTDTVFQGQPERLDMSQEGTWLGSGCGGILPLKDVAP